ncbi:unnamed protein product [Ectocarpus sp. CCAP 1310/34]|nr:unnamed protein product [Ectocarpus sp. CCAP 1310/34]
MQELYEVYVKERKNSVAVELSYPSERYQISRPRGQVLYYIAGVVYVVERGIFHFLENPIFLAACLGELPAEIFKVVSESEVVKEMWGNCCPPGPPAIDPSVSQEMFLFEVGKILDVRMGDYAKSVPENTSLKFTKAALGLRQQLNAQVNTKGRAGGGAGSGAVEGGAQGDGAAGGGKGDLA